MIEINLLPGQKKKKKAGAGFQIPDLGALLAQVKDPLLLGTVGSWAVVLGAAGFLYLTESRKLADMETQLTQVEGDAKRFQALINQKRKEEKLRDSLRDLKYAVSVPTDVAHRARRAIDRMLAIG